MALRGDAEFLTVFFQTWRFSGGALVPVNDAVAQDRRRDIDGDATGSASGLHFKSGDKRRRGILTVENAGSGCATVELANFMPEPKYVDGVFRDVNNQLAPHEHRVLDSRTASDRVQREPAVQIDGAHVTIEVPFETLDRTLVGAVGLTRAGVSVHGFLRRVFGWVAAILATALGAPHLYKLLRRKTIRDEDGQELDYTLPYPSARRSQLILPGDREYKPPRNLSFLARPRESSR